MANVKGSTSLSSKLNLNKVLYVPDFAWNLISVAKLSRELRCIVIFDTDLCVIQNRATKSLIGVGRLREGIYHVDKLASPTTQKSMW